MRRHSSLTLLFVIMAIALFAVPAFSGEDDSVEAPLSPQYLEWLSQRQSGDTRPGGHIPFPADLSHLADNPPDESLLGTWGRNKDGEIPSTYDLRSVGVGIVAGPLDPFERDPGLLVPGPVVAGAGTGAVFVSADEKRRAPDLIWEIRLHRLGKHPEAMAG